MIVEGIFYRCIFVCYTTHALTQNAETLVDLFSQICFFFHWGCFWNLCRNRQVGKDSESRNKRLY